MCAKTTKIMTLFNNVFSSCHGMTWRNRIADPRAALFLQKLSLSKSSDMFMNTVLCSYSVHLLLLVKKVKHMCLNKVVIFVFFAQKSILIAYPHSLIASLIHFWALNGSVPLLSIEGQKALGFNQKYLNLCSEDERKSYGFGRITEFSFLSELTF